MLLPQETFGNIWRQVVTPRGRVLLGSSGQGRGTGQHPTVRNEELSAPDIHGAYSAAFLRVTGHPAIPLLMGTQNVLQ